MDLGPVASDVTGWWIRGGLLYVAYAWGKQWGPKVAKDAPFIQQAKVYGSALLGALFIAFMAWAFYGEHTVDIGVGDPLYGGGRATVVDFAPSAIQRLVYGASRFVLFALPVVIGVRGAMPDYTYIPRTAAQIEEAERISRILDKR
jgi:hypothetical protein